LNGLAIACATGLAVLLWDGRPGLVLVIALAMVVNMTAAGLFGAAIPLALRALGRDPAQSASIFLTTVTDVGGFAAFLGFAVVLRPFLTCPTDLPLTARAAVTIRLGPFRRTPGPDPPLYGRRGAPPPARTSTTHGGNHEGSTATRSNPGPANR